MPDLTSRLQSDGLLVYTERKKQQTQKQEIQKMQIPKSERTPEQKQAVIDYQEKKDKRQKKASKLLVKDRIKASGLSKRHAEQPTGELFEHGGWHGAYQKLCKVSDQGGIAILLGDRGTGKTQAAAEVIKISCSIPKTCQYIRAREINNVMLDMQGDNRRQSAVDRFVKPYLLVIDELQDKFDTDYAQRNLTLIIDKRYGECKPTILVANCTPKQIIGLLGSSIYDRIKEGGGAIEFNWKSFRGVK